ncbi:MAG: tetratricopeptide repeat protein [Planctomycetota bacterium]
MKTATAMMVLMICLVWGTTGFSFQPQKSGSRSSFGRPIKVPNSGYVPFKKIGVGSPSPYSTPFRGSSIRGTSVRGPAIPQIGSNRSATYIRSYRPSYGIGYRNPTNVIVTNRGFSSSLGGIYYSYSSGFGVSNLGYSSRYYRPSLGYPTIRYSSLYSPYAASPYLDSSLAVGGQPVRLDASSFDRVESRAVSDLFSDRTRTTDLTGSGKIPTMPNTRYLMQQAESAFFGGRYEEALRTGKSAKIVESDNGRIYLFLMQAAFAVGKYDEAAQYLTRSTSILPSDQWGYVVRNFRQFYGQNDFVNQTRALDRFLQLNPDSAAGFAVRGYQFANLGYLDAAISDLAKSRALNSQMPLAVRLSKVYDPNWTSQPDFIDMPIPSGETSQATDDPPIIRLVPEQTKSPILVAPELEELPDPEIGPDNKSDSSILINKG